MQQMTGFTWRVSTRKLGDNKEGSSNGKKDKHRKGKHGGRWQMARIWWIESSVEMVKSDSSPPWVSDYARIVHPKEDLHTSCCVSGLEQANEASFEDKSQQIIFPSQRGGGGGWRRRRRRLCWSESRSLILQTFIPAPQLFQLIASDFAG